MLFVIEFEIGSLSTGHVFPSVFKLIAFGSKENVSKAQRNLEAHSLAVLQSQYARPSSSLPIAGAGAEVAEPMLNWKTALSEPPRSKLPGSHHKPRRLKQLNLQLIHQCTSSWALEASLQRLITEFNSSGKEDTLIEFTARRNEFFFTLLTYLNLFWVVITGTPKTLIVEHIESASNGTGHQAAVDYVLRSKASFRDVHENKLITVWTFNEQKGKILLTSVSLSELWLKSAKRRACGAIVFNPRLPTSGSESSAVSSSSNFNLWRGLRITRQAALAVRPTESSRELQRAIQPFLDHIRIIWCRRLRGIHLLLELDGVTDSKTVAKTKRRDCTARSTRLREGSRHHGILGQDHRITSLQSHHGARSDLWSVQCACIGHSMPCICR